MMSNEYKYAIGYSNAVLMGLKSLLQTLGPKEQATFLVKLSENAGMARSVLEGDAIEGFDTAFNALSDLSPPP